MSAYSTLYSRLYCKNSLFSEATTNNTISARPTKIVAGLEVTKTLELLMTIVFGIETQVKYLLKLINLIII